MAVRVKIPILLRKFTENNKYILTCPGLLSRILNDIKINYPLLFENISTGKGNLKGNILFFFDNGNYKGIVAQNTLVEDGSKLKILFAVSGG